MAASASGGTALIPVIGAAVIGIPVVAVMALAFSDFNVQVDAADSPREAEMERATAAAPSGGAALGLFSGAGGASKPRLNLLGRAAMPAPRPAEDVDVRIAPLLAGASGPQPTGEEGPTDDVALTEASADAPLGRMAMLQTGNQNWGGVQGGGGSSGAGSGWSGFGGGASGFGGSASRAG